MKPPSTAAKRYARALLELAYSPEQIQTIGSHLSETAEAWSFSKDLQEIFLHPGITSFVRKAILKTLAQRMNLVPPVENLLLYLADHGRMALLPDIWRAYADLAEKRDGFLRAEVVTASVLPESYYGELQKTLEAVTGKRIILIRSHDPALLGGVIAKVEDRVFDGSIRQRLSDLAAGLLTQTG